MIKKFIIFSFFTFNLFSSEIISYEKIVDEAVSYNLSLKILEIDKEIAQANIDEIESLFSPQVDLELNTQYTKDMETNEGRVNKFSSSFLQDDTMYTGYGSLNINWDIIDFGIREYRKKIALIDKKLIDYSQEEKIQELKLKLLEYYTKIIDGKKQLNSQRKIKLINEDIYNKKRRLYEVDQIDRLTLANEAIKIVEQDRKILELRAQIEKSIKEINYLTNKKYIITNKFLPLNTKINKEKVYENSFIHKSFKEKIKQKRYEISIQKNEQYPKLKFFYNYNYYDEGNSWKSSLGLREKNYQFGLKLNLNLFDGFKSQAQKRRLKAELKKLVLEDIEQKQNYKRQKNLLTKEFIIVNKDLKNLERNITKSISKTAMLKRLDKVKNIDTLSIKKDELETINKIISLDSKQTQKENTKKQMEILGIKYTKESQKQKAEKSKDIYIVYSKTANIREKPSLDGKVIDSLDFKTKINVEYCNSHNWCKLKEKEAYIARFLIDKI